MKEITVRDYGVLSIAFLAIVLWVVDPIVSLARETVKARSANQEAGKLIDEAWAGLDQEMTITTLTTAAEKLESARRLDPSNDALLVELAGTYFQLGYQMPESNDREIAARNANFQKGYDLAMAALQIRESAGAHAWIASNLGALKQHEGMMSQAAILPEVKKHLDWITSHDKDYKYGFATRVWLAMLSRSSAFILKMMGQDADQVIKDIDQAIINHPGYLENRFYKAEFYYSLGKKAEALEMLDNIINADPDAMPSELAFNRFVQKTAKAFKEQWSANSRMGK